MSENDDQNYFSPEELRCPCCNRYHFVSFTLDKLNELRRTLGFPLPVTSGYRCKKYNAEKGYTQTHSTGQAVDIACSHKQAYEILKHAPSVGFTGIGIKQKGDGRFIHLDDLEAGEKRPRPHIWSY